MSTIQQRINHLKEIRRFKEVKPAGTFGHKRIVKEKKFKKEPVYLGAFKIVPSNVLLLKSCYKSGSWVRAKCLGREWVFWTSRKLKYFAELPNAESSRNFGAGIITKSQMTSFHNVIIDHDYPTNSLNIYNRGIIKKNGNFQHNEAFYLCVNGADNFQHFVQDFLPILVSLRTDLNEKPNVPILLNRPSMEFQKFDLFFDLLNISNPRIYVDSKGIGFRELYFLDFKPKNRIYCLPSEMYRDLFDLVLKEKIFKEKKKKNLVCFIRDEKSRNFADTYFVKKELTSWANCQNLDPIFLNPSHVDIKYLINALSNAKYVFGAHGGAIYNMLFASRNATLIEFIATDSTDSLMHIIRSFGQHYLPYAVKMDKGSFEFKISKQDFNSIFKRLEQEI
jgi:hypothetical protein